MLYAYENVPVPSFLKPPVSSASTQFSATLGDIGIAGIQLPTNLHSAAQIRRAEFFASRLCVRQALTQLDGKFSDFTLRNSSDRLPQWPTGYCGSITHTSNYAAAAVSSIKDLLSIGIDSELIFSPETQRDVRIVATASELEKVQSDLDIEAATTLIFSAKESVFKAIYPLSKRWLEFEDVILSSANHGNQILEFGIPSENVTLTCKYEITSPLIHTFVAITPEKLRFFQR